MNDSIVPYTGGLAQRGRTARGLAEISSVTTLAEAREDSLARLADVRIANGCVLLERTVLRFAALDGLISSVSHDRPGLEMTLRAIQQDVGMATAGVIRGYVQR
jgi:hypothetical protein